MQVKITKKDGFACAPEGHTVVTFKPGDVCEGRAADMALASNAGKRVGYDPREATKVVTPPETKAAAPKRRGRPKKTEA